MRTFYTFFILLAVPLAVWGQRKPLPDYNPCIGADARLSHSSIVYKEVGENVFHSSRVLNIEQTSEGTTNKHYIYLRAAFTQPNNSGKWGLYFKMTTPPNIEPVQRNGNYPEGVNVDKWYDSKANIPAGTEDPDAPKPERGPSKWESFPRYSNRTLTIGIKRKELDNFTGDINTATYNNQSNPIAVKFEVSPNIHRKNLKMILDMSFYNGEEKRLSPVNTVFRSGYCDINMASNVATPTFSIDLIRPTFENMAETTTKVDEVFELSIPAKDVDESGATIAQNFPTNVTPESYQDMEDGVFINLISVKKIVNLAGGGKREETHNNNSLPKGLYIDQRELKIKGTPEEIGEFKIELTATDAAGNGHRQGTGTPSNWQPTPVVLKLNITPRYGLVNPGMRMRVAQ